ncbi:MAG: putative anti-sigma regulatory factor, serine/threonine protein kinase [Frankiales bacterium]|nr:putative anti-sigma regulatory factor, serine/threonine protein kinase [Frankiales bacterium]
MRGAIFFRRGTRDPRVHPAIVFHVRRAELQCAGIAASVAVARRFVRTTLSDWDADSYEWTTTTLVSELATNAVLHAGTDFRVTLTLHADSVLLEVADGSPLLPVRRRFESTATTGRGMRLVEDLAQSWSVTVDGTNKVVACFVAKLSGDDVARSREDGAHADGPVTDISALLAQFADDDGGPSAMMNRRAA